MFTHNYQFHDDVHYGARHPKWAYHNSLEISIEKETLPASVDLSDHIVKIYDQGSIGACVSNALSSAVSMKLNMKNKARMFSSWGILPSPSRLYNYNLSRLVEGERLNDDGGCMIETGIKVLQEYNFCNEELFEYDASNMLKFPTLKASINADYNNKNYSFKYNKLTQDLNTIKASLAENNPIAMGIVLFDSMNKQTNGLLPTPNPEKEKVIGGHAILLVGYDDNKKTFKFVNCWSERWGNKGFGYIMYDYALNPDIAGDVYNVTN